MIRHHVPGPTCPGCEEKLLLAHPELVAWYRRRKSEMLELHISWSYRGQETQNHLFSVGLTRELWPKSKHNACGPDGKPLSNALDLFVLDNQGHALYPWTAFKEVSDRSKLENAKILWGHDFKSHKEDGDHFERSDV